MVEDRMLKNSVVAIEDAQQCKEFGDFHLLRILFELFRPRRHDDEPWFWELAVERVSTCLHHPVVDGSVWGEKPDPP
jgi:hypothetical protein